MLKIREKMAIFSRKFENHSQSALPTFVSAKTGQKI
jgi:hypothetical protein